MKKRKILLFALSATFLVSCAGLLASCDDEEHTHTYEQTGSTAATCTEAGSITKTCSVCGDVVTETVNALGHDYTSAVSSDGTERVYTCSRCGDTYSEAIKTSDEDTLVFTANNATLTYSAKDGAVTTAVSGAEVALSAAESVTNNDASGDWWTGGTDYISVTGDFVVQYKWTNTRDTSYTDAVVELTDGTDYWDNTTFADLWGNLYTAASTTSSAFYLNGAETTSVALGTEGYFGGDYTVTIVRNGDGLIICENLVNTDGDVYAYVITQSGFTTADLTVGLTGNPYWIDDITVATSTGATIDTPDPEPTPDPDPTPSPVVDGDYVSFEVGTATVKSNLKTGDTVAEVSGVTAKLGEASDLHNYDTDGGTWWSGGTDTVTATGDFIVRLTWSNTRDTSYTDAVIEINNGSKWWDANSFEGGGWGDLYTATTSTTETFYLNGAETTKVALGTAGYFEGNYTATVVRSGDQLVVVISLVKTNGDVYTQVIQQNGFTTDTVYVGINGNPYWIDDIKGVGAILGADLVNYTVNFLYEDGTTAAESVTYSVSEGSSLTFTTPYVKSYMPEREVYRVDEVTGDSSFDVIYHRSRANVVDYIDYGYISGENAMTLPEGITLDTGVSISFLLSNSGSGSDWAWLISAGGYNVTYGNLTSEEVDGNTLYPSATAYGGDNWNALLSTEEIFVTVNIYRDSIVFYKNGEKVIEYASTDQVSGGSYVYGMDRWARKLLNFMIADGFTFNAQTFTVHRLAISTAMTDTAIKSLYEDIAEAYQSELVVKYICSEDNNHLLGEYRWNGLATDYSITPPDLLGYEVLDSSTRTGRAEYGRTTIYIDYAQNGIATLTLKYVDTEGNELLPSETKEVTIPYVVEFAPEIENYTAINEYESLCTMKHGGTYMFIFEYKYCPHEKYENGYCAVCGKPCSHEGATTECSTCGAVWTTTAADISLTGIADVWTPTTDWEIVYGQTVTVSGTQTSAMPNNWSTILFEFTEGFTGRFDAWGWTFGNASLGTGYTCTYTMTDASGNVLSNPWDYFQEVNKACDWTATCTFGSRSAVTVTVTSTATSGTYEGYTWTCIYNLPISDRSLEAFNMHMNTGGSVINVKVTSTGTWAWYPDCDEHVWKDGVCTKCGRSCSHTYENGICTICGATNDTELKAIADAAAEEAAKAKYTEALAAYSSETGIATLGASDLSTGWWTAFQGVTPTYNDDGTFDVTVTGYQYTPGDANYHTILTILYSDTKETAWTEDYVARMDNYGWGKATAAMDSNWNWDTYLTDVNNALVTINVKFDGASVVLKYTVTPILAGQSYEGTSTATLSDGTTYTATATYTVDSTSHYQSYTLTGLTAPDNGVGFTFTVENTYFIFTDITGGTLA